MDFTQMMTLYGGITLVILLVIFLGDGFKNTQFRGLTPA